MNHEFRGEGKWLGGTGCTTKKLGENRSHVVIRLLSQESDSKIYTQNFEILTSHVAQPVEPDLSTSAPTVIVISGFQSLLFGRFMTQHFSSVWTMGWVEVICGSMFSGKTEELIRRIKRAQIAKQKIQLFKPIIDNRYSRDHVTSHSDMKLDAKNIERPEQLIELVDDNTRIVGIDEAQFLSPAIVDVSQRLANRGLRVVIAGLDLDYRGQPFGPMPNLMAIAEMVTKMSAICTVCGNPASRTQRRNDKPPGNDGPTIIVGAQDLYEARCRRCYEVPDPGR